MRKPFALLILCLIFPDHLFAQDTSALKGNPITEIFADFHYFGNRDTSKITGFDLTRAFFGYNFNPGRNLSATLILNVGNPSELATGSKDRRYAFFREASITWSKEKLAMSIGMTTTRATIYQQRWLGKRYLADNFESLNGYAIISDLGISADYTFNKYLKADFTLMNGEGYSELHIDKSLKSSLGLSITPNDGTFLRLYGDLDRPRGVWETTLVGFAGFRNPKINAGVEASRKTNLNGIGENDSWGFSGTCTVKIIGKAGLVGRYDYVASENTENPYLYQFVVAGIEYVFTDFFKMAIDYQGTYNYSKPDTHGIFLNAHFRIWETSH